MQEELTKYVMKEKFFPKKWRYLIGQNVIAKLDELMDNIINANSIYPVNEHELQIRKDYQTRAIANCFQLQNKILRMEKCIDTVKLTDLTKFLDSLAQEVALLKAWKKASKVITNEK